jgi:hypothetical protein
LKNIILKYLKILCLTYFFSPNLVNDRLRGFTKSILHVILYGDFTNPEYQEFSTLLRSYSDVGKGLVLYAHRHYSPAIVVDDTESKENVANFVVEDGL